MRHMLDSLMVMVYNLTILVGTVYLIVSFNWDPWWMLLAVLLLATTTKEEK